MLFSSNAFIFLFLPIVLVCYYTIFKYSRALQNLFLLVASLFFYAWGEPIFVYIMIMSIIANWIFGYIISRLNEQIMWPKFILTCAIIFNISIIFVFKYLTFTLENLKYLYNSIKVPILLLPIGISFFTFQAISYVIDIYRGSAKAQTNPVHVGLYISLFPQLIAGPIVRYETIATQIVGRKENFKDFSEGICRFIVGLGKKVILANTFAIIADNVFSMPTTYLSLSLAWLGAISYTFQIFFDFSGYSDMAIGLGKMFGFHFLENFNYPYISKSISEFWRRWHISLGSWFLDYVYIPLGGSRVKRKIKLIRNLFIVWLLTGLWHGASWNFIIWGLMYFVLITFEKMTDFNNNIKSKILKHIYSLLFIVIGWVIFRSVDMAQALSYLKIMFLGNGLYFIDHLTIRYISEFYVFFIAAIIFSMPIKSFFSSVININWIKPIYPIIYLSIFLISISFIAKSAYNPFIYFNF